MQMSNQVERASIMRLLYYGGDGRVDIWLDHKMQNEKCVVSCGIYTYFVAEG